ncbi:hypothetical protein FRC10_002819 [Ceratobasidium sp. 414]|nr:hypothetical protein FRC10_002819 [Ceratobasidium sp. 414]
MTDLSGLTRTEPFRTLFTLHKFAIILLKLPIWVALYVRRSNRPRASWSLTKAVLVKVLRNMPDLAMRTGRFNGRDVTKEVALKDCWGTRFIWLDGVSPDLITGQVKQFAEAAGAQNVRIPAYGFGQWDSGSTGVRLAGDGEKIVMHLHGGYVYLVQKLGFKPQNIIIAGDSAGGNLGLALVRYLRDSPKLGLGMPGGLLLLSPWCDPAGTHHGATAQKGDANAQVDYISPRADSPHSMGRYAVRSFLGNMPYDVAVKNLYIGPASLEIESSAVDGMFTGFPPSYILSGEGEMLVDEIRTLQHRMLADLPEGKLVYDEVADAVHDFTVFRIWEPERSSAFQRVAAWIREL